MLDILEFIFSSFWIWLGTLILLSCCICSIFAGSFITIKTVSKRNNNNSKKESDTDDN